MSINDLLNTGAKSVVKLSAPMSQQSIFDHNECTTPFYALNIALGGELTSGIIPGIHMIAGPSRHFKTMYGMILCKTWMDENPDGLMLFYDSEFGASKSYFESVGIDTNRVAHVPVTDIESLCSDLSIKLENLSDRKFITFIDSLGNLASRKEVSDALDEKDKADMTRAKVFKSLFRIITPKIVLQNKSLVGIAHTYETMELYSKKVMSGGTGMMYSANDVWILNKAQEKDGKDLTGYNFSINIEKSRRVKDKVNIPVIVKRDGTLSTVTGLFDIALELGSIKSPKAGWYVRDIEDDKSVRRKDVEYDEEYFKELIEKTDFADRVKDAYKLKDLKIGNE